MDAARYQRLKELLFEAQRLPDGERSAFLGRACGDDEQLRSEVDSLLRGAAVETKDLRAGVDRAALNATDLPPPPWHCGAYRIEREVGRGGMGVVFEAIDVVRDERVAVKLVPPLFVGAPQMTERFAREAELGRQIDHPNVVRTIDYGSVTVRGRGVPYLVMEFVEGETLRELLDRLGTVPESLLREIAEQVGRGLVAIHARGIVHRDLKPENIVITRKRAVRIMDLGIAKLHDASLDLTREGQFLGSLPYAAPEQCGEGEVGPRSDLYSLGVVLYELATGRNPFRRGNPAAALHAQLDFEAPPLTDTSPFFSELVATLLAKDPSARFLDAAEFVTVLDAGERGTWWANRRSVTAMHAPVRLDVPRRTRLVGRDAEHGVLRDAWRRARSGQGGTLLITGEAGIGKSRLVDEFLREAGSATTHVLCGSFLPGSGLRGIADAVLSRFPSARIDAALEPYLPDAPALRGTFAALLRGEAVRDGLGDVLVSATSRLLEGMAHERPVLFVLEDLQDAPAAAWRVVQALARTAARRPVMLVLTARPPLAEAELEPLLRTECLTRLDLPRLDAAGIGRLVREALGEVADADAVAERVARKSDGNPLFALALLDPRNTPEGASVPSEIRDLIAARLSSLDSDQRMRLDAAAVQGAEFDAELLAGVLEQPVVGVLQDLAELERSLGLVRAAGRQYRFDHNLLQEVLYAELPERLRAEYHTRIADAYERRVEGEPWGVQAEFLARHHLRGVEPERALPHVSAALAYLGSRYLHEAGIELIDRTLGIAHLDERERLRLLEVKESLQSTLGRKAERRETVAEIVRRAEAVGEPALRATAARALGSWHQSTGHEPEALEAYERAVDFARESGDRTILCLCLSATGSALTRLRRQEDALEVLGEALTLAGALGNRDIEAKVRANYAQALRHACRYEEARAIYERVIEIAREIESEPREMGTSAALGVLYTELGLWREAESHLSRARDFGRRSGSIQFESPATGNLGVLYVQEGRLAEARACARRHQALAAETGARRSEAVALGTLGAIEMMLGHPARARTLLVAARQRAEATHAPQLVAQAEFRLGRLALLAGDPAAAKPHFAEAARRYRDIGHRDFLAAALIDLAACDIAGGRAGDAEPRLREALEIGEALDLPSHRFGARALLGDEEEADAIDADEGARIPLLDRMLGRARMGRLAGARELLERLVEHAPAADRDGLVDRVPFYRSLAG